MNQDLMWAIIFTAIVVHALFFAFFGGRDFEWEQHRKKCGCDKCSDWRAEEKKRLAKDLGDLT